MDKKILLTIPLVFLVVLSSGCVLSDVLTKHNANCTFYDGYVQCELPDCCINKYITIPTNDSTSFSIEPMAQECKKCIRKIMLNVSIPLDVEVEMTLEEIGIGFE